MITQTPFGWSASMQRQGDRPDIDPNDVGARRRRIAGFEQYMGAHPGAAPGGTGDTGLSPIDAKGWSKLLEQRTQYADDVAAESGRAGPARRFGGYSGGILGGGGGGTMATGSTAGQNLRAALMGGNSQIGAGMGAIVDKLSHGRSGEGAIRALREAGLLQSEDEQAAGAWKARRMMATPEVGSQAETDLIRHAGNLDREQEYENIWNKGQAESGVYWRYGQPIDVDTTGRKIQTLQAQGEANAIDDKYQAEAEKYKADQVRLAAEARNRTSGATSALAALRQEINSARQYEGGDSSRVQGLIGQLDAAIRGMGGEAGGGAPQQFSPEIENKLKIAVEKRGWTRDDAIAEFQRIGIIPR